MPKNNKELEKKMKEKAAELKERKKSLEKVDPEKTSEETSSEETSSEESSEETPKSEELTQDETNELIKELRDDGYYRYLMLTKFSRIELALLTILERLDKKWKEKTTREFPC